MAKEDEKEADGDAKGGGRKKLIIIALPVVVLVLAAAWFLVLKPKDDSSGAAAALPAPKPGTVVPLADVADPAFARGTMGKGVAVLPTDGEIVSPVSGTVVTVFGTKHVVGLRSDDGVEVLVHVGIDTVNLGGKGFTAHVADGDRVTVGQRLLTVDLPAVAATHDTTTVVVITNSTAFAGVEPVATGTVAAAAPLLAVETLEHALETTR